MTHYGICAVGWRVTATRLFRASAETLSKHRKGLSLGTALTLPGAAASPNMGDHSSPALSVLLTLFNVRLGGWYGNPGPAGADSFWRVGPTVAVKPLALRGPQPRRRAGSSTCPTEAILRTSACTR